ncbi:DNL-type zinc finger protein [Cucurbita argyrosperma subsp. argyrosperma]|nr:DNL-type zinc finger protein [Cucurbita argyrosperma subsp. argyrosperma]
MATRRILSLALRYRSQTSLPHERACHIHPFANSWFLTGQRFWIRGNQSLANSSIAEDSKDNEGNSVHENKDDGSAVKYSVLSNLKSSPRHDLAMIFTCKVCETRSIKTVCRESYEKGVVVARCGGCNNLHLIADHLGWFGEPGSVEDFLAARGEEVRKGSLDSLSLSLEDLAGKNS